VAKPDRIYASELLEREVMDLRDGAVVGSVTDFNVTRDGVVTQLGVLPLQWYRGGKGIAPGAITNVTRERVSIDDAGLLDDFDPDGETSLSAMLGDNLYGKQVLQADGELLGLLADFAFDLGDGRITDIVVYGDDDKRTKIGVDNVHTIGKSYIVISRGGTEVQTGPKPAASQPAEREVARPVSTTKSAPKPAAKAAPAPEAAPLPPVAEEIEPAVAAEPAAATTPAAKTTRRTTPAAKPKAAPRAQAAPAAKTPTGRKSRPDTETATGRKSRPATETGTQIERQLDFGPEAAAASAPAAAEGLDGLGLSTFDRRKAEYLLGRNAHRDIRSGSGELVLKQGSPFNRSRIAALMEAGMLNAVFLEMTQHKS
jgi:sporulation protein YlmC with PRC-barrel domain